MPSTALTPLTNNLDQMFQLAISNVREEMRENTYIEEALRVLPVGGYRSAIGSFWNAVVDDLRNKILHRSVKLFNKAVNVGREIKTYEDFQNYVTDDQLIDGAYQIGVIDWEAQKILKHAKETRHVFDGHPRSSPPSVIKVLAMLEDCAKYVLQKPMSPQIVGIDDYMAVMATPDFDRSEVAITDAITELPEIYTTELINRLFTTYIHENASSDLRSNIEVVAPMLWVVLPKELKIQVVRRVDQEIQKGNAAMTREAFAFVRLVKASAYLSVKARRYILQPLIDRLRNSLDQWSAENACVKNLEPYASNIPPELVPAYVWGITQTYVGQMGHSAQWNRTDFYADAAAARIPGMFEVFDDAAAAAFLDCVRKNETLQQRVRAYPVKMERLRSLGKIVLGRVSAGFSEKKVLQALADKERVKEFWQLLGR
jgi:hypothetical protein